MVVKFPIKSIGQAKNISVVVAAVMLSVLAGCARAPAPQGIYDPDEGQNRGMHAFNLVLDRAIVSPGATGYGKIVPQPVQQGISNVAGTLDLPGDIANNLLQFRFGNAAKNSLRLAVNLTLGIGGLFDPAKLMDLPENKTDFGETLHVWGAEEGAYVVLPGIGPSTTRDTVGTIADLVLNPLRFVLPTAESNYATLAKGASRLGDRNRYSDTVDSILYDSADGYAQARLLYLQNRRFELGQNTDQSTGQTAAPDDSDAYDPYEDPYGQ